MASICHNASPAAGVVGLSVPCVASLASSHLKTILLVEDQDVCRITTKWFLANFGYRVVPTRSAEAALALFAPETHDVIVTDNDLAGLSGLELAHIIKLRSPSTPVIMYTGQPPADLSSLDWVIEKSAHLLTLKEAIDKAIAARHSAPGH